MSGDKKKASIKPTPRVRSKSSDRAAMSVETFKMLPSNLLKSSATKPASSSSCDLHLEEEKDTLPGYIPIHNEDIHNGSRPVAFEEELQGRVYELSALLNQWQKRAKQYKQQVTSLTSQLRETRDQSEALVYAAKHEQDVLVEELKATLTTTTSAKLKMEQDYNGLQLSFKKSLEQNKKDMETLHGRWKKRSTDLEKLRSDNKEMRQEISTLSEQIKSVRKDNERLSAKNEQLKVRLEGVSRSKTENDELRKENELLKRSVEDLSDHNANIPKQPQCSCMSAEYRILFELTLLKLQALERQQTVCKEPYTPRDFKDNDKALLESAMDLARMGGGNGDNLIQNQQGYLSDSTDSCGSPRSPPTSAKFALKSGSAPDERPKSKRLSDRPMSALSFSDLLFYQPSNESKLRLNDHASLALEDEFRQRAFSESAKERKRFPLNKSYTTEDSRIAHAHLNQRLDTQNMSGGSNPDVFSDNASRSKGSNIPVKICSDEEAPKNQKTERADSSSGEQAHASANADKTSGFGGLRSRRNGITNMPLDVSVALRMNDVKKSKDFSHLLRQFTKDKPEHKQKQDTKHKHEHKDKVDSKHKSDHEHAEKKFPGIRVRKLSRKKSKSS